MGVLIVLVFNFLYFLVVHGRNDCQPSFCGSSRYLPMRFPFRLPDQPEDCGYPGFELSCNIGSDLILNLTYAESFSVFAINYKKQSIELYHPYSCLPNRLLNLNLSSSPFSAVYYTNYFTCLLYTLEWDSPNCKICETNGNSCEFKNFANKEIQCHKDPSEEMTKTIGVITATVILPIVFLSACIVRYKCTSARQQNLPNNNSTSQNSTSTTSSPERASHAEPGLDHSTIRSYPTVILGESRRITGPNGTTCPICLADYLPKDILRCIPECQHCFHAHCIDEWLRLKSICPVCRNSPTWQNVKL